MTCTHANCGQWAQWRVVAPVLDEQNEIIRLDTVGVVCGPHKDELQAKGKKGKPSPADWRFNFVGAVPDGAYHPKS